MTDLHEKGTKKAKYGPPLCFPHVNVAKTLAIANTFQHNVFLLKKTYRFCIYGCTYTHSQSDASIDKVVKIRIKPNRHMESCELRRKTLRWKSCQQQNLSICLSLQRAMGTWSILEHKMFTTKDNLFKLTLHMPFPEETPKTLGLKKSGWREAQPRPWRWLKYAQ